MPPDKADFAQTNGFKAFSGIRQGNPLIQSKYPRISGFLNKNFMMFIISMEKYIKRRPALLKPDEIFDYYELDETELSDLDTAAE